MRSLRRATFAAFLLSALVVLSTAPGALAQDGVAATIVVDGASGSSQMTITTQGENLRMDMAGERGDVSMMWLPDRMVMIMHPQQMYMEFDEAMMERMRGMMGNMPQHAEAAEEAAEETDFSEFSFEETGNTDVINGMNAFEVAVSGPDAEDNVNLWLTEDTDIGMFEVFAGMGAALESMNMPMMNRGDSPAQALEDYTTLARVQGLPSGRVIRVVNPEENTTITLQSAEAGPFGAETWSAPEGYTKQQMPGMQH